MVFLLENKNTLRFKDFVLKEQSNFMMMKLILSVSASNQIIFTSFLLAVMLSIYQFPLIF
jgi:hypothetical protein